MDPHKRQQPEVSGCFYLWFAFVALIGVPSLSFGNRAELIQRRGRELASLQVDQAGYQDQWRPSDGWRKE